MILYHGSKSGIKGDIKPISREACDFGSGFYMGDKPDKMSRYEKLCTRYKSYNEMYDIIVGVIADDKMTQVMNLFFAGNMCDRAFIEALQYVKLGKQYVLKTDRACQKERFNILSEHKLTDEEVKLIQAQNTNRKNQLNNFIHQIQTKYRRAQNVKFFDEILEEWNK